MKSFKTEGKVVEISSMGIVGDYKKREVVVEVESGGDFPNSNISLVAWNEKADSLDEFKVGDSVIAEFRPKSIKSKKGSWFSNLNFVSMTVKNTEEVTVGQSEDDCPF